MGRAHMCPIHVVKETICVLFGSFMRSYVSYTICACAGVCLLL